MNDTEIDRVLRHGNYSEVCNLRSWIHEHQNSLNPDAVGTLLRRTNTRIDYLNRRR